MRRTYTVCPDCAHPNVHVHGEFVAPHYARVADKKPCPGSGKPAPEKRDAPRIAIKL